MTNEENIEELLTKIHDLLGRIYLRLGFLLVGVFIAAGSLIARAVT